jgi:hypothetical protein
MSLDHPIFRTPEKAEFAFEEFPTPEEKLGQTSFHYPETVGKTLRVTPMQTHRPGKSIMYGTVLVNDNGTFADVPGLEQISEGICSKELGSLAIARQGRYLFWGFTSDPSAMTEPARAAFRNAVHYLYACRNSRTTPYVCKPRGTLTRYLSQAARWEDYRPKAMKMFAKSLHPDLRKEWTTDIEAAKAWLAENRDYVYADGTLERYQIFQVDDAARRLRTPNHRIESLQTWVRLARGEDPQKRADAEACLERYVDPAIRPPAGEWTQWWDAWKSRLVFVDTAGFRFVEDPRLEPRALDPEPAYFLGWYSDLARIEDLGEIGKQGCNLVIPYSGALATDLEHVERYLDRARAENLRVMPEPPRDWIRREDWTSLRDWIDRWKDHPAVVGWYLFDEPELQRRPGREAGPDKLKRAYLSIKNADPKHPILVAFNREDAPQRYAGSMDHVMWDRYVCHRGTSEFQGQGEWTKILDQVTDGARAAGLGFLPIVQAYGLDAGRKFQFGKRNPTYAEARYQVYACAVRDSIGVAYWCFYRADDEVRGNLTRLTQELLAIGLPAIRHGKSMDPDFKCDHPAVRYKSCPSGHLMAVNGSAERLHVRFTLPAAIRPGTVEVLGEDRKVAVQGELVDRFEPFQVHVYRWGER